MRFVCHAETETCCPTEASREGAGEDRGGQVELTGPDWATTRRAELREDNNNKCPHLHTRSRLSNQSCTASLL